MQQEIVQFTPPVSPEPYGELFALYAHLNLEKKRHQVLLERAMACYPAIRDRVKTQALIATPTAAEAGQGFLQLDDARLEAGDLLPASTGASAAGIYLFSRRGRLPAAGDGQPGRPADL